jgi:hypothetical protein
LAFCWVTIAACVPYLALKAVWVSGATAGFGDLAMAADPTLHLANAITFALDLWVYVLVYGGFTGQAVGLAGGFVLYTRRRWPELFRLRTGELSLGPAHRRHAALARAASLAALAFTAAGRWAPTWAAPAR